MNKINPPNVPPDASDWEFLGLFGSCYTEQLLIRRIESKMKEFDPNFVESLLEGVKRNQTYRW